MSTTEQLTIEHYARAELERSILAGLHALGVEAAPTPEDLAAVDEFHMGGRAATLELAAALELTRRRGSSTSAPGSAAPPVISPGRMVAGSLAST
jgi:hypothetical protein